MSIGRCRASTGNNHERQYLLERNTLQIILYFREKIIRINKADTGHVNPVRLYYIVYSSITPFFLNIISFMLLKVNGGLTY